MTSTWSDAATVPTTRISRLGAYTFAIRVASYGLGLVAAVLIARALGPEGRGRYYVPVTMATVGLYIGSLATHQSQFRMWALREATPDQLVTSGLVISAASGAVAMSATLALYYIGRDGTFSALRAGDVTIAVATIPIQIHALLVFGLLALGGKIVRASAATLLGAVAQVTGVAAAFLLNRLTVEAVLLFYALSVVVPWLVMLPPMWRVGRIRKPIPFRVIRRQLVLGIQLLPYILFTFLNLRFDVFVITRYRGIAAVGLYSVAVAVSELVWLATDSVSTSVAERQGNAPLGEAVDVTMRSVRMSVLIAVLLGIVLSTTAPFLIPMVYGAEFSSAQRVVWWLAAASVGMAVWRPVATAVVRFSPAWVQPAFSMLSLGANVTANLLLVPRYGIMGAGLASTLSYWCGALLSVLWLATRYHVRLRHFVPSSDDIAQLVRLVPSPRRRRTSDAAQRVSRGS